jgi:hypothetical protein
MTRTVLTAAFASAVTILGISFAQAHSQGTGTAQNDGPALMQLAQGGGGGGGGAGGGGGSGSSGSSTPQGPASMPQGGTTGTTPQDKADKGAATKQVRPGETPTNNPPSK